jgi:hypothetical protein
VIVIFEVLVFCNYKVMAIRNKGDLLASSSDVASATLEAEGAATDT